MQEAVIVTKATKPDLVLLDINLTDGNAFDYLDQLDTIDFKIIFITAYEQHALKAIKNGAIDYILKPVDIDDLKSALDKAISLNTHIPKENIEIVKEQLIENSKSKMVLNLHEGFQIIEFESLMFCKSDQGYTNFYLADNKTYIASKTLKEFESQIPMNKFFRTHQSYLINMDYVDKYDKDGYVFLRSGDRIPVASRRKDAFLSRLLDE